MKLYELLEDKRVLPNLNVVFSTVDNLTKSEFEPLYEQFSKLPHFNRCELDREDIEVIFANLPREYGSSDKLDELTTGVQDILENANFDIDSGWQFLYFIGGLPAFPVEFDDIRIYMDSRFTLQGIDKLIGVCDTLTIEKVDRMKPSPVLSLLRLPHCNNLLFEQVGQEPKWCTIVQEHFLKDKDILDCQEELIRAGFKEYAKL